MCVVIVLENTKEKRKMDSISGVCRGCMLQVASHKRRAEPKLAQMFTFCTNLRMSEEEKLPQHFCLPCSESIESCFTFINTARNVDSTLRNYLSVVGRDSPTDSRIEPYTKKEETADCENTYDIEMKIENDSSDENEVKTIPTVDFFKKEDVFVIPDDKVTPFKSEIKKPTMLTDTKIERKRTKRPSTKCPLCKRTFSSQAWYEKHVNTAHKKKTDLSTVRLKNHVCSICSKGFSRSDILKQHMVTHSDERPFSCHICPRKFKLRNDFNRHLRMHRDQITYECDHCHASFAIKSSLFTHMRSHDEMNHQLCSLCGAKFTHMSNLVQHMRTHTGEKPFACPHCPFRCALSSSLGRHKRIHNGAKPYTCNTCGKNFRDYSAMGRHIRTHTGERPYRCNFCSEAFIDTWKRKLHVRRHHPAALTDFIPPASPSATPPNTTPST